MPLFSIANILSAAEVAYGLLLLAVINFVLVMGLVTLVVLASKKVLKSSLSSDSARATQVAILVSCLPISALAIVAGFATGISRESAVGAVLPAVLTFLGGLSIYFTTQDIRKALAVGLAVVVFSVNLTTGAVLGSFAREAVNAQRTSIDALLEEVNKELVLRRYRSAIGLPPTIPGRPSTPASGRSP